MSIKGLESEHLHSALPRRNCAAKKIPGSSERKNPAIVFFLETSIIRVGASKHRPIQIMITLVNSRYKNHFYVARHFGGVVGNMQT